MKPSRRFVIKTGDAVMETTNTIREALRIAARAGGGTLVDTKPEQRRKLRHPVYIVSR